MNSETATLTVLRAMWRQLHRYALEAATSQDTELQRAEFFQTWASQFPPGCPCQQFWTQHITIFPPPQAGEAFFWWTIHTHDYVNAACGKPIWHPSSVTSGMLTAPV